MSDQELKVGVVFEFKGIDDIEQIGVAVEKAMKSALGQFGVKGGVLEVRMANVEEFKQAIALFQTAVKELANVLKNTSIKIDPSDAQSKSSGARSSGAISQQGRSQISLGDLSKAEAVSIASSMLTPLTATERKLENIKDIFRSIAKGMTEFERDIYSANLAVSAITNSFDAFEDKYRNAMGGTGSMILKSIQEVDSKFQQFGQRAVGGITIIDKAMSSMFRGQLNEFARMLVSVASDLDSKLSQARAEYARLQADPTSTEAQRFLAKEILIAAQQTAAARKAELDSLAQDIDRMDTLVRQQEDQARRRAKFERDNANIENRIATSLQTDFTKEIGDVIGEGDSARIRALTDNYEGLGRSITNQIKQADKLSETIRSSFQESRVAIQAATLELQQLESTFDSLPEGEVKSSRVAAISSLRSLIANTQDYSEALEGELARIEASIVALKERKVVTNQMLNTLRKERRESEETAKANENAYRGAIKARRALEVAMSNDIIQGIAVLDPNTTKDVKQAERALSKLDSEVINVKSSIKQMGIAFASEMAEIDKKARNREGEFSVFAADDDLDDNQMAEYFNLIDKQIQGLRKKTQREIEANEVALERASIIRQTAGEEIASFLKQAKSIEAINKELEKQVGLEAKLARARANLVSGTAMIASGDQDGGSAAIKLATDAYKGLNREIEAILLKVDAYQAEGGQLTAEQLQGVQALREYQRESQRTSLGIDNVVSAMKRQIDALDRLRAKSSAALENPLMKIGAAGLGLDYKDAQDVKDVKDAISATRSELARLQNQKVQIELEFKAETSRIDEEFNANSGIFSGKAQQEMTEIYNNLMSERSAVHRATIAQITQSENQLRQTLKNNVTEANQDFLDLAATYQKLLVQIDNSEEAIRRFGKTSDLAARALKVGFEGDDFGFGLKSMQMAVAEMNRYSSNARKMIADIERAKLAGVELDASQEAVYDELVRTEEAATRFATSMDRTTKAIKLTKQSVDSVESSIEGLRGNLAIAGAMKGINLDLSVDMNLDLAKKGIKSIESSIRSIEQIEVDIILGRDSQIKEIMTEAANQVGRFADLSGDALAIEARRVNLVRGVSEFYNEQLSRVGSIRQEADLLNLSVGEQLRNQVKTEEVTRKTNDAMKEAQLISAQLVALAQRESAARAIVDPKDRTAALRSIGSEAIKLGNQLDSISAKLIKITEGSQEGSQMANTVASTANVFKSYGDAIVLAEKRSEAFDKTIEKIEAGIVSLASATSIFNSQGVLDLSIDFNLSEAKKAVNQIDKIIEELVSKKRLAVIEFAQESQIADDEFSNRSGRFQGINDVEANEKLSQIYQELNNKLSDRVSRLNSAAEAVDRMNASSGESLRAAIKQEELQRNLNAEFDKLAKKIDQSVSGISQMNTVFTRLISGSGGSDIGQAIFGDISSRANAAKKAILDAEAAIRQMEANGASLTAAQKNLMNALRGSISQFSSLATAAKSLENFLAGTDKAVKEVDITLRKLAANPIISGSKPLDVNIKSDRDAGAKALKDLEGLASKIAAREIELDIDFNFNIEKLRADRVRLEGIFSDIKIGESAQADSRLDEAIKALTAEYQRAKVQIDATKKSAESFYNLNSQRLFDFERESKDLEKVEKAMERVDKVMTSIARNRERTGAAFSMLNSGDNLERISGLQQLQKAGSEARSLADEILKLDFEIRQLTNSNVKLTSSQQQKVDAMIRERNALMQLDSAVRKRNEQLERQKRLEIELGQALQLYNDRTADSIRHQFAFINALTVVTSVIFGVRMAFSELINESRAFARTLTVMESNTNDFAKVYENLKEITREVSVEFGRSIDEVAEIVKQFGSAGFSAEEAMSALRSTTQLIVSTNGDAETSARAIAGIYRVFGKELKQTGSDMAAFARINDVLLGVYKFHQAELDEMVQGFRFAGSAAKIAGFSYSETSAMLAVLNDNMIKSGTAGRGLQVVLAQVASKSDQFQKAFGVTIDRGAPLTDQFLSLLSQVNAQMSSGVYTVAELDKRFKLFGLRGARSFAVLAEQFPAVLEAMERLDKESKGLGNQLSQIVKNELATQFEGAKQALIGIAREFIEPAKNLLVIFADLIKGARDIFIAFDPISSVIASVILFTAVVSAFLMTLKATLSVLVVMGVQFKQGAALILAEAKAAMTNTAAFRAMAAAKGAAAASSSAMNSAAGASVASNIKLAKTTKDVASASTAMGAATTAGSVKIMALVGVVVILAGLFIYFSNSVRTLRSRLDELAGSLSQVENNLGELKKFEETIDSIQRSTLAPAAKANSVLQILKNTNGEVIRGEAIASKSRQEITEAIDANIFALKEEAEIRRRILETQQKQLELQAKIAKFNVVDKEITSIDLKDVFTFDNLSGAITSPIDHIVKQYSAVWGVLNSNINEGGLGSTSYLNELVEKFDETSKEADRLQGRLSSLRNNLESRTGSTFWDQRSRETIRREIQEVEEDLADLDFDEIEKKYSQRISAIVRIISEAAAEVTKEGEKIEDNALKILDQQFSGRFSDSLMKAVRAGLSQEFFVPIQFRLAPKPGTDIKELLYGPLLEVVNTIDAPIPQGIFSGVTEEFVQVQIEVEAAGEAIRQMQQAIFQFDSQTNVSTRTSDRFKQAKDLLDQNAEAYQTLNKEAKDFSSVSTDSVDGFIDDLNKMGDLKTLSITNKALMEMFNEIASIQELSDDAFTSLSDSFGTQIADKASLAQAMFEEAGGTNINAVEKAEIKIQDLASAYLKTREAIRSLGNETESVLSLNASMAAGLSNAVVNQYLPQIQEGVSKFVSGIRSAIMTTADLNPLEQMINRRNALSQQLTAQALRDGSKVAKFEQETIDTLARAQSEVVAQKLMEDFQAQATAQEEQLQTLKDQIGTAETTLAQSTGSSEQQEAAEKQLGALVETYKKRAELFKLDKEIALLKIQEVAEQRKINQRLAEYIRLGEEAESLAKVKVRALATEIQYWLKILRVQELLGRSQEIQQYFISEIQEKIAEVLELQNELMDSVTEEVAARHEALSLIEKALDSENKFAGVQNDITAKAAELNRILFKTGQLERQLENNKAASSEIQSEIQKGLAEQAKVLTDILSHEEKWKNINKEKEKALKNQHGIYKEIADLLGDEVSRAESALAESISNRMTNIADDEEAARQLARVAGVSVNDAIFRREEVMDKLFQRMKSDYIPTLAEMADEFAALGDYITETAIRQEAYRKASQNLAKEQAAIELDSFFTNLDKGTKESLKEAGEDLEKFKGLINDAFTGDPNNPDVEARIAALTKYIEFRKRLQDAEAIAPDNNNMDILLGGLPPEEFFAVVKARLSEIMTDLNSIQDNEALIAILKGQYQAAFGLDGEAKSSFENAVFTLVGSLDSLTNAIRTSGLLGKKLEAALPKSLQLDIPGWNTGGKIPGYGGGDTVPAMLEPGEYVIPKHIVKKMGTGFFEKLRAGQIPGFQNGGSTTGVPEISKDEILKSKKNDSLKDYLFNEFTFLHRHNVDSYRKIKGDVLENSESIAKNYEAIETSLSEVRNLQSGVNSNGQGIAKNHKAVQTSIINHLRAEREIKQAISNNGGVKLNTGGRIPGYGGGDTVPAMLEPGEYVIPKHIVKKMGTGFFEKLRAGQIPGFKTGGMVGGDLLGGAAKSFDVLFLKMVSAADNLSGAMDKVRESFDGELPLIREVIEDTRDKLISAITTEAGIGKVMKKAVKKGVDEATKSEQGADVVNSIGESSRGTGLINASQAKGAATTVTKEMQEWAERAKITSILIEQGLKVAVGGIGLIATSLSDILVPEFAAENARLRAELLETISQIQETYEQTLDGQVKALQRNETSYYAYLNAIQDAERARQEEILAAQEQYRESLRKTGQVMMEVIGGFSQDILAGTGAIGDAIASSIADEMQSKVKGAIAAPFLSVADDIDNMFKQTVDPKTGKVRGGGIGTTIKDGAKGAIDGLDSFFTTMKEAFTSEVPDFVGENGTAPFEDFEDAVNKIGEGMYEVTKQGAGFAAMLSGFALGGLTDMVSSLISMTMSGDMGKGMVDAIEKFIEELPETIPAFIDSLIENTDRLLNAIADAMPAVVEVLVEEAPRFLDALVSSLEETLPTIVEALAKALPESIRKVVPILSRLVQLVIQQIPTILESLAESIPTMMIEVLKQLPAIAWELLKAIVQAIPKMIGGFFKGIFGGIFHQGGIVNTPTQEALILAKKGEGILTPETVRRIGGASAIQALNAGMDPASFVPNTVDPSQLARQTKVERISPNMGSSNSVVNNNFQMSVPINGSESDRDLRAKADTLIEMVDEGLNKLAQDRKSKFARRR